jgi:hypothetical protein
MLLIPLWLFCDYSRSALWQCLCNYSRRRSVKRLTRVLGAIKFEIGFWGSQKEHDMRYLRVLALFAICLAPIGFAQAQHVSVGIGVGVGPAYVVPVGPAPVCAYGYYPYAPYACAPYGYYGPSWFSGGLFIGAGPWYHGGFYGRPGYWGRPGWGHAGVYGRPGFQSFGRGSIGGGFHGGGAPQFHSGGGFHGNSGFHGGGGSHGGGHGGGHR